MEISTADLYDELGESVQSVSTQFQNLGGKKMFSGRVRTVKCYHDNVVLKSVLSTPGDGAVLVVDGGGSLDRALMGDMIAEIALTNNWSGVIIYGAIRDRAVLATLPLGVKALGSNPRKSAKEGAGEVDVPVAIGGIIFSPGAMVHADEDGILVLEQAP
ncbi:ribonuclease E activity regulator RraA [Arthrobacter sp. H20]|uniref:ribonuclease E activity regulator RraA n=1 Tax=Arthrobacter sp. H20 TaxID=1267981 RepID=UPI000478AC58|nr:ribonuclease E activity regulator RraA [Arthrobacter sp. H20]